MPYRLAIRPIRMPPTPVPKNASDTASAGTCRAPPVSAAISFKPTAVIHGPPNDRPSSISEMLATTHDVRVSIECGAAAPAPKDAVSPRASRISVVTPDPGGMA